jgi:AcrR family transcriptional regulator
MGKLKTRWGDSEGRRRDLLAAARNLLERDGYEALSVREVARGAGVSAGLVYTYFGSREQLFAVLYAERLLVLDDELQPLCARATGLEELLVAVAERYFEVYRVFGRELNLWALLVGTHAFPEEVAAPLVAAAHKVMATVMLAARRIAAEHGLDLVTLPEAPLAVPWVWATLSGLADQFVGSRHRLHGQSRAELVRFSARMMVAGLRSLAPPPSPPSPPRSRSRPRSSVRPRRRRT